MQKRFNKIYLNDIYIYIYSFLEKNLWIPDKLDVLRHGAGENFITHSKQTNLKNWFHISTATF